MGQCRKAGCLSKGIYDSTELPGSYRVKLCDKCLNRWVEFITKSKLHELFFKKSYAMSYLGQRGSKSIHAQELYVEIGMARYFMSQKLFQKAKLWVNTKAPEDSSKNFISNGFPTDTGDNGS